MIDEGVITCAYQSRVAALTYIYHQAHEINQKGRKRNHK